MKKGLLILAVLLAALGGLYAQDLIVLRDGNIIEARIIEISPTEIRYKRFNHLDGPTIVVPARDVLSLRYENGTVEMVNAAPAPAAAGIASGQAASGGGDLDPSLGAPTLLQTLLNRLPAVTIAGNNLKFQFGGDAWVARLNGQNFSRGTLSFAETGEGGTLTLLQTHLYPGAVSDTAGRIAGLIPGGGRVGSALNAAGNVADALGPIEASGTIVLDYRAGPPPSLSFVSASGDAGGGAGSGSEEKRAAARKNWILGELNVLGGGFRYERMLGEKTSLSFHPYFNWRFWSFEDWVFNDPLILGIDFVFRFYPMGGKFFVGAGLGYHYHWYEGRESVQMVSKGFLRYEYTVQFDYDLSGIGFPLELGWKFDPGRAGGFYLETGAMGAFVFGKRFFYHYGYSADEIPVENDWGWGGVYSVYVGVGLGL